MNYPILLTPDGRYQAILQNAYNIIVEDEILTTSSGYETLTFLMSNKDKKRQLLGNERMVEVQGRRYVIRVIEDLKNNSNVCTVTCDALWYDLNDGELKYLMHADPEDMTGSFKYLGNRILQPQEPAMSGNDVKELQKYLNSLGYSCGDEDGVFGNETENGVKNFERDVEIKQDGIVDALFVEALGLKVFGQSAKITSYRAVAQQLEGTGWNVGVVNVEESRPAHTSIARETSLFNLRQISGNFGGDLFFDTAKQTVSLLSNMGIKHQEIFRYEKNTVSIKRTVDTRNLFTRFTLIGKDADGNDVTVSEINDGKDYVENYSWYDMMGLPRKLKCYQKTDDRWSDKQNMLDYMNRWIDVYSKPVVGYELDVSLFQISPNLGDYVYVYDKELGISGWLRVVSRKKNVLQPQSSTVQLEATKKTIVESIVTSTATSQSVQEIVSGVITPDMELKLPHGTEGWVMQYVGGSWKASNVLGDIGSILDSLNGEVL